MTYEHRPNLPPMPDRIRRLPVSPKGYPVPFFVAWIDGVPDFRVADGEKVVRCVKENRCWVCGEPLGKFLAFTIGPMCSINRVSAEPPAHRECSLFSAVACPFLTLPNAVRREAGLPSDGCSPGGIMIERNPGVTLVWVTTTYRTVKSHGGIVFRIGEPTDTLWFAHGRAATQGEVMASIKSGLPLLQDLATEEGPEAVRELAAMTLEAMKYVPRIAA